MNWSDIKPGDKFTVEFTCEEIFASGGINTTSQNRFWDKGGNINKATLVAITPKPKPIEVGCLVYCGSDPGTQAKVVAVFAEDNIQYIAYRWIDGRWNLAEPFVRPANQFKRVD
jgi:hypothetical protein